MKGMSSICIQIIATVAASIIIYFLSEMMRTVKAWLSSKNKNQLLHEGLNQLYIPLVALLNNRTLTYAMRRKEMEKIIQENYVYVPANLENAFRQSAFDGKAQNEYIRILLADYNYAKQLAGYPFDCEKISYDCLPRAAFEKRIHDNLKDLCHSCAVICGIVFTLDVFATYYQYQEIANSLNTVMTIFVLPTSAYFSLAISDWADKPKNIGKSRKIRKQ